MNFSDYQQTFDRILSGELTSAPYDDPHFIEYVKLNHSRQNRWVKKSVLIDAAVEAVKSIHSKQTWVIIAEPWCGDAAQIVPFIVRMAELNPLIHLEIKLRDNENSEIENYLTNGGKSIPKLIIRDKDGKDLVVWGPRPLECQQLFDTGKGFGLDLNEQKIELQKWYNEDEGKLIQKEICSLFHK
jgi:thiol-disulfide isomerase/thioredoxin